MRIAPPRPNEAADLDALRSLKVLDTSAGAQFDALVDATASACDTPIAVISLIDVERQWFKACLGLPGVTETPRDVAFCAHAVLGNDLFEVPDALADERFHDNPLVTGAPYIRFYAGMPLRLSDGACIGTLCVIDRVPRSLTPQQGLMLRKLAAVAAHALERHRDGSRIAELEAVNRRLYEASPALLYSVDPQGVVLAASDMLLAKLGYTREEVVGKMGTAFLTPESREKAFGHTLPELARSGRVEGVEYRIVAKSGAVRDVSASARMEFDEGGRPLRTLSVMEDITERKQAERALKIVLDAVPSMIGHWDNAMRCTVANVTYANWLGVKLEAMHGKPLSSLLSASAYAEHEPYLRSAQAGHVASFEWDETQEGCDATRHWLVHYIPELDQGRVVGMFALMNDVTEVMQGRTMLASARRQNEALLNVLNEHAIVSIADRRGLITHVNDNFCQVSGYGREELIGQNHRLVNAGQHGQAFWRDMWRSLASKRTWKGEVCNRAKNGALYWVDSVMAPMLDDEGKVERYISIRYDITPRKLAADALEASHQRFDIACEAASIGVWTLLPETGEMEWDTRMWRLFDSDQGAGMPAQDVWHQRIHSDDIAQVNEWVNRVPESDRTAFSFRILAKDGSIRHLHAFARLAKSDARRQHCIYGICMDQTDAMDQELRLKAALDEAEKAARARSQFLANMSHEIRTPMNAVIGLVYLLHKTNLDADQRALLDKVDRAGKGLMTIINDILDVTRIEAGELPIEHLPFSLAEVVDGLDAMVRPLAESKGLEMRFTVPEPAAMHCVGDAARLHQILLNLLSNAIKFTQAGRIEMVVRVLHQASDAWCLRFEVSDTGIGIDSPMLPRLFSPFSQADASTTRRFGGSGLGLAIVKQLAALMGGDVGVFSVAHKGSTFWVELPFGKGDGEQVATSSGATRRPEKDSLRGVRVLAVDDSGLNLEVLRRTLEGEGAAVTTAMNGQDALDALGAMPNGFDIVLMDAQMPILDGYDATRRIRSGLGLVRLPVIALTAGSLSSEQARAREAGMNGFIAKPFEPQALIEGIRAWVGLAPVGKATAEKDARPSEVTDANWPCIEGIDSVDARRRLGGQVDLFLDMVQKLLIDFQDIEEGLPSTRECAQREGSLLLNRMHTLKGNAGTLGARDLAHAAAQAEALLRDHADGLGNMVAMERVRQALSTLRASFTEVTPALVRPSAQRPSSPDVAHGAPVAPQDLTELIGLLEQGNMQACDVYKRLKSSLDTRLPEDAQRHLQHCMNELRFAEAAEHVKRVRQEPSGINPERERNASE